MKGKSKYLVLLLLLLVVCGGMVTYAIYKTNKSGNATVNAARWNVVFKNGESEIENNFNIQLSNATWTNPLGNVASGKIAPGSSATFYITIDATGTETDVDYTVEIDESFDESDFEVTLADDSGTIPYSTATNSMVRQIPIQVIWNGNINDSNTKNNDDLLKKARDITIPIKLTAAQKLLLPYTIRFSSEGNIVSTIKVAQNAAIGTLPSAPVREGYLFKGWYTSEEGGTKLTQNTIINQNIIYYARWKLDNIIYSVGDLVYFDPASENECDESANESNTCYSWRIIDLNSSNATIQLNENLGNKTSWNETYFNTNGPLTVLSHVATLTSSWNRVSNINYEYDTSSSYYNYGKLSCIDGSCTVNDNEEAFVSGLKARLITVEEYNSITGNKSWLFDNNASYWTLSPNSNVYAYFLSGNSLNGYGDVTSSYFYVRPVITVPKTDLNY